MWCLHCLRFLFKCCDVGLDFECPSSCLRLPSCMSNSSCPSPSSKNGASGHQHPNPVVCDHASISPPHPVVGSGGENPCPPPFATRSSFAKVTAFGVGSSDHSTHTTSTSNPHTPLSAAKVLPSSSLNPDLPFSSCKEDSTVPNPSAAIVQNMDELNALCLLGQIWGDHVPLSAIIYKTKNDWKFLKGQVEYVELGNHWILLRFVNVADKDRVWGERPWFVGSFNFVLTEWIPFFDPFSASISHIDQWVRVPRLPWEFWDFNTLTELMLPVGKVIRVDQNTLLRLKGKFARVCVHIDITEPLPGSLVVEFEGRSMKIPLIYEGLHEVCALCGNEEHQIESCALIPPQPHKEVRIEKFGTSNVISLKHQAACLTPSKPPLSATEKWIRVSPKKRIRTQVRNPRSHVPESSTPLLIIPHSTPPLSPTHDQHHSPMATSEQSHTNLLPRPSKIPQQFQPAPSAAQQGPATDRMVTSPSPRDAGSPSGLDDEEFADSLLHLEPIQDIEMSTDSIKRKREEEGEECLSKMQN